MEVFILSSGLNQVIAKYLRPKPSEVESTDNSSYVYYKQQLYMKLFSVFKFSDLPPTWSKEFMRNVLFREGVMAVFDSGKGIVCLNCSPHGVNLYNMPIKVRVHNHELGSRNLTIGVDTELLYINRMYDEFMTVDPLITRYAMLMAQTDVSINMSLINSRVAHIFHAESDAELKSLQKMYDDVTMGKPAVFLKSTKKTPMVESDNEFLNVKQIYIANDILQTKRTIMNEFLTEIGINNANTDKRERLNADEVNANNGEVMSLVSLWLESMQECFTRINSMFGTTVSVEMNEAVIQTLQKEVEPDANNKLD